MQSACDTMTVTLQTLYKVDRTGQWIAVCNKDRPTRFGRFYGAYCHELTPANMKLLGRCFCRILVTRLLTVFE